MGVIGTTLAGRYRLERMLAEGGMGEVWVARHLALDIPVAVKLMGGAQAIRSNVRSRFQLEAKAIAQLRCPNIVQIIDFGTEQDTPFIVMELLEGSDLLTLIPKRRLWPLDQIADIVTQVGKGLAAAHARGIIHRDIKPGNIFLSKSGADTIIKLLDFGIAKWVASEQNLTETDAVLGSPFYMSPEQVRGERLDARADLWSLSVVAYRLATGALPFEGRDAIEVAERVMVGKWRPVPSSAPKAAALQKLFERAFAERQADRFPNAAALTQAFVAVSGGVSPAWAGDASASSGENTVTIVRPRISHPEDASVTEISQSLLLADADSVDTEPEVSTVPNDRDPRIPRPALAARGPTADETLTRPFQPYAVPAPPPSHPGIPSPIGAHPPPPSQPSSLASPLHPSAHLAPAPAWVTTQRIDPSDFLATGKHEPLALRRSLYTPDLPPARSPATGVVISLGLCGALVVAVAVWIAVNVSLGSKATAAAEGASAMVTATTPPAPPTPPPPPQQPTGSATAPAPSSAPKPSAVTPTKRPSGTKSTKSGVPSFLHPR